jgi:hypothetical protein
VALGGAVSGSVPNIKASVRIPARNVRWTHDGRVAVVEMEFARELYEQFMAGWVPCHHLRLANLRGDVMFVVHTGVGDPPEELPA